MSIQVKSYIVTIQLSLHLKGQQTLSLKEKGPIFVLSLKMPYAQLIHVMNSPSHEGTCDKDHKMASC